MAFNWKKFVGGVASGVAADIRERREDAKDYEEEQEELAERNIPRVQKKQLLANEAAQLGLRARSLGATDAQISNALSSGVNGIKEFHDKLQAAAQDAGVKTLGKADIDALVNMPNIPDVDFKFADGEYQDFVQKTYGLGTPKVVRPEEEDNLLKTFFAFDAKDRAKRRLADRELFEGMSVAQINAAARDAEYESLFPESTMTFSDINFFGPKDLTEFSRDIEKDMAKAGTTDRDELEIENAKALARQKYMDDNNLTEIRDLDIVRDINNKAAANALTLLQQEAAKFQIQNALDKYHRPDLLTDPAFKRIVIAAMGEPYFNSLLEEEDMLEKDFGIETEDIPFSDIPGFTGDAEADEEFRRQKEAQDDQQQQPSTEEKEITEEKTPDTKAEKEALLDKTYPKRPPSLDAGRRGWDRKYEGKVDPNTGKAIIVDPRPPEGGEKTKTLPRKRFEGTRFEFDMAGTGIPVTEAEYWDAMYGDTHDPNTGMPIGLED